MSYLRNHRTIIWGIAVGLFVFACLGWARYVGLRIQVALGEEQVRYFAECLEEAIAKRDAEVVPSYVFAVTNYYPSGTKQRSGSLVDDLVEQARALALRGLERQEILMRTSEDGKPVVKSGEAGRQEP